MSRILRVGLTGGIASGKSTGRRRCSPRSACRSSIPTRSRAGSSGREPALQRDRREPSAASFSTRDGELDRRKLREPCVRRQAGAGAARGHPAPAHRGARRWRPASSAGGPYQVLVVPLLLESGFDRHVDRILVVDCPEDLQRERLLARDGADPARRSSACSPRNWAARRGCSGPTTSSTMTRSPEQLSRSRGRAARALPGAGAVPTTRAIAPAGHRPRAHDLRDPLPCQIAWRRINALWKSARHHLPALLQPAPPRPNPETALKTTPSAEALTPPSAAIAPVLYEQPLCRAHAHVPPPRVAVPAVPVSRRGTLAVGHAGGGVEPARHHHHSEPRRRAQRRSQGSRPAALPCSTATRTCRQWTTAA